MLRTELSAMRPHMTRPQFGLLYLNKKDARENLKTQQDHHHVDMMPQDLELQLGQLHSQWLFTVELENKEWQIVVHKHKILVSLINSSTFGNVETEVFQYGGFNCLFEYKCVAKLQNKNKSWLFPRVYNNTQSFYPLIYVSEALWFLARLVGQSILLE